MGGGTGGGRLVVVDTGPPTKLYQQENIRQHLYILKKVSVYENAKLLVA